MTFDVILIKDCSNLKRKRKLNGDPLVRNNHVDIGEYPGLVRGYNIEYVSDTSKDILFSDTIYVSCGSELQDVFTTYVTTSNLEATGQVIFRGYFVESNGSYELIDDDAFLFFATGIRKGVF